MKTDDPRLEESQKRLTERIEKLDNMILTVLKNHVVVEQFMIEFLDACGKKSEELTFAQKITRCEEQTAPEIEKPIWDLLKKVNQLRNKIAHKIDGPEVRAKVAAVRTAYLAAITEEQKEGVKGLDEARMSAGALQLCGSYIVVATENKKDADKKLGK
jgi:hypothetical protein